VPKHHGKPEFRTTAMPFTLSSPAFADSRKIPPKYTADGENISPPLEWREAPDGTRSYALIVDDPDAPSGVFRHWAVYNIIGERDRLPEAVTGSMTMAIPIMTVRIRLGEISRIATGSA
jgi:Raf kinase inhibitor-like YbhB/YbcL family protein